MIMWMGGPGQGKSAVESRGHAAHTPACILSRHGPTSDALGNPFHPLRPQEVVTLEDAIDIMQRLTAHVEA